MRNLLLLLSFLSFLLSACGPDYLYEETSDLEEAGWTYTDTLNFQFTIDDTPALYNLYLEVEHTTDYSYQNLYTQIHTQFPSGQRMSQVVSLELADKAGVWPIQANAFFNEPGTYVITLEQYMRRSPVTGLTSIGFMLEETGEKRN